MQKQGWQDDRNCNIETWANWVSVLSLTCLAQHNPCQPHLTLPWSLWSKLPIFVQRPPACRSNFWKRLTNCNCTILKLDTWIQIIYSRVFRGGTLVTTSSSSASASSFFLLGSNRSLIRFFWSTRGCFRRDSNDPIPFRGSLDNEF